MSFRVVKHEVEAHLFSPAGKKCGKSEFKIYGNGERRLKVVARRLEALGGETVALLIAGRECVRAAIAGAGFTHDVSTSRGEPVPEPRAGDRVELRANGALVASGVYEPD